MVISIILWMSITTITTIRKLMGEIEESCPIETICQVIISIYHCTMLSDITIHVTTCSIEGVYDYPVFFLQMYGVNLMVY